MKGLEFGIPVRDDSRLERPLRGVKAGTVSHWRQKHGAYLDAVRSGKEDDTVNAATLTTDGLFILQAARSPAFFDGSFPWGCNFALMKALLAHLRSSPSPS